MAAGGKWIESRPDDTGKRVARRALRSRLDQMWRFLVRSVDQSQADTENIHQLRVFSRRAAAAMDIFEECLPKRQGSWMRKRVKHVRKASGEARDFDVLLMRWAERLAQDPSDEAALVVDEVKRRRREAQKPIEAIYEKLRRQRFPRRISKLLAKIHKLGADDTCGAEFACMARAALARLVNPCLAAGESELTDAESLHAFRIQGKQVRYAMEIFAGAFAEDFRQELYPLVAALQDRLGAINDHVTARAYFAQWQAETDSCALGEGLSLAMEIEQQSFEASKQALLAWWTSERREDLRRRFARHVQLDDADERIVPCERRPAAPSRDAS